MIHSNSILYSVNIYILFKTSSQVCNVCWENLCVPGDDLVKLMSDFYFILYFNRVYIWEGARGKTVGWGTALQVGRSRVRFPMVWLEFFINTLRTRDADLCFYITTVQDGWRKSAFLTRSCFPCTIHFIMQYIEPVSEWSCWRMFIEIWPHSELNFRHRASSI